MSIMVLSNGQSEKVTINGEKVKSKLNLQSMLAEDEPVILEQDDLKQWTTICRTEKYTQKYAYANSILYLKYYNAITGITTIEEYTVKINEDDSTNYKCIINTKNINSPVTQEDFLFYVQNISYNTCTYTFFNFINSTFKQRTEALDLQEAYEPDKSSSAYTNYSTVAYDSDNATILIAYSRLYNRSSGNTNPNCYIIPIKLTSSEIINELPNKNAILSHTSLFSNILYLGGFHFLREDNTFYLLWCNGSSSNIPSSIAESFLISYNANNELYELISLSFTSPNGSGQRQWYFIQSGVFYILTRLNASDTSSVDYYVPRLYQYDPENASWAAATDNQYSFLEDTAARYCPISLYANGIPEVFCGYKNSKYSIICQYDDNIFEFNVLCQTTMGVSVSYNFDILIYRSYPVTTIKLLTECDFSENWFIFSLGNNFSVVYDSVTIAPIKMIYHKNGTLFTITT